MNVLLGYFVLVVLTAGFTRILIWQLVKANNPREELAYILVSLLVCIFCPVTWVAAPLGVFLFSQRVINTKPFEL